jgi:DNA-3-methyladenine glycosylase II
MTREPDIEAYLAKADPKLGKLIAVMEPRLGKIRIDKSIAPPFESLVRAIIYQQMAGKAAATIYKRFQDKMEKDVTPKKVLAMSHEALRAIGMSNIKADYIRNVAQWFSDNPKPANDLPNLSNEEILEALTSIKGIGEWSANVFLIFTLGRMDVVPVGDLGLQRASQLVYDLKEKATDEFIQKQSAKWKPYQSIASIYLWQSMRQKITAADLGRKL